MYAHKTSHCKSISGESRADEVPVAWDSRKAGKTRRFREHHLAETARSKLENADFIGYERTRSFGVSLAWIFAPPRQTPARVPPYHCTNFPPESFRRQLDARKSVGTSSLFRYCFPCRFYTDCVFFMTYIMHGFILRL